LSDLKEAHRRSLLFKAAATYLSAKLPDVDWIAALDEIWTDYTNFLDEHQKETDPIGSATSAKLALNRLAAAAEELLGAMSGLTVGAASILDYYEDEDTELHQKARLKHLPELALQLEALVKLANGAVAYVGKLTSSKGASPFYKRMGHIPPEEWLAYVCLDALKSHEIASEAPAVVMVYAMMQAAENPRVKIKEHVARAIVRRVMEDNPNLKSK